jgi:DNA-binding CsgD family transcriptional regulator
VIIDLEDYLAHYGVARRSGRYPWGSGGEENVGSTRNRDFLDQVALLRRDMTEVEVAKGMGFDSVAQLRAAKSIAKNAQKAADISMAERLKAKGMSNIAIGQQMGLNESSVRALLAPGAKDRNDVLTVTSNMLRDAVKEKTYVDVGIGVERHLSISREKLDTAIAVLRNEGYAVHPVQVPQLGTGGNQKTTHKVLAPKGTSYRDIVMNLDKLQQIQQWSDDGGRSYVGFLPPKSASSSKVKVVWAEDGGGELDGLVYVRPGKPEYSLGGKNYAQVRIPVDGTHFIKGMAVYKDDLPAGIDLVFHTNKPRGADKLEAMKPMKDSEEYPFGAVVRQITKFDKDGKEVVSSVMNLVNDEGKWEKWSKNLSTQMLSKQTPALAKEQLNVTYENRKSQYDEIMALTNPTVRKKLLEDFASDVDSSAVHLKAAAMPRQQTRVIIPINSLKEGEIYAPNFRNGERVVLIRYPHGGIFEIPELRVNKLNREGRAILGNAPDAVGINSKTAAQLSGADFDGDTVLVIPNNRGKIKTGDPLESLKNFDPVRAYPAYEGMPKMKEITKQKEMGKISNLITDMTIRGANTTELARAVRHSMVVIDAEKKNLNYKQSEIDHGIRQLKEKYQQGEAGPGRHTLITNSGKTSTVRVPEEKLRTKGGSIDPATGKLVYVPTGATYVNRKGETVPKTTEKPRLSATDNAFDYAGKPITPMEKLYAEHSNRLKVLANQARKESVNTKEIEASPSAKKVYANEVASLNASLNIALKNAPRERQAQVLANAALSAARQANPDMTKDELKKIQFNELEKARIRTGAKKTKIEISDAEWEAIQAGAVPKTKLSTILDNANMDLVKKLATPKTQLLMSSSKTAHAKRLLASGYDQQEVADMLGVSLTTLKNGIS